MQVKGPIISPRVPPGASLYETLRALGSRPMHTLPAFLQRLTQRHGPVASFRLPWQYVCLINDADLIKEVLVTRQHDFTKSPATRTLHLLLGEGLLTSEEPLHRKMRRIVQPAFHKERLEQYSQIISDRAWAMSCHIPSGWFDMHALMTQFALGVASTVLFGMDAADSAEEVSSALHEIMELFPLALGPIGALRLRLPLRSTRRFEHLRSRLNGHLSVLIEKRRHARIDSFDALTMLMQATDAHTGEPLSDQHVRDEAMTLFIAGHETTANAMTWMWYLLAQHPRIAQRVQGAAQVGNDDYLRAVINESLRLYPPAWMIGRRALRSVPLGDYVIPQGGTVIMSPFVTQRSETYFRDPERFDPDRWLKGEDIPQFAYFPFGGGSRRCIGEQFALMELLVVLRTLAKRHHFENAPHLKVRPVSLVTLRPEGPVYMRANT